jgi:hypothetical protein
LREPFFRCLHPTERKSWRLCASLSQPLSLARLTDFAEFITTL